MPFQCTSIGSEFFSLRQCQRIALQGIIVSPILELFMDTFTNLEVIIWRHGHVARVEKAMNVAPHQDSVRRDMFTAFGIGFNMCGL